MPTINVVEEWRKAGVWNDDWIVETVRITPWGKTQRPYFFEQSVTVTLTTPWLSGRGDSLHAGRERAQRRLTPL